MADLLYDEFTRIYFGGFENLKRKKKRNISLFLCISAIFLLNACNSKEAITKPMDENHIQTSNKNSDNSKGEETEINESVINEDESNEAESNTLVNMILMEMEIRIILMAY